MTRLTPAQIGAIESYWLDTPEKYASGRTSWPLRDAQEDIRALLDHLASVDTTHGHRRDAEVRR